MKQFSFGLKYRRHNWTVFYPVLFYDFNQISFKLFKYNECITSIIMQFSKSVTDVNSAPNQAMFEVVLV